MRIAAAFLFVHIVLASVVHAAVPTLRVEGDDGNVALALTALKVTVTVRGHLARTELELTYHNDLDRDTEGQFEFPLPPDAEVSDVGLYFGDTLRHAVAVERALARRAYDETVHRGVDPALVEWNAGRAFKLRVYPIPAKGDKKVFIAYDQELTSSDYELDVRYGRSLAQFDLDVDAEGRERVIDGVVRVPRDVSETALAAHSDEDNNWYASAAVDVKSSGDAAPRAQQVVIFYDTSSSSVQQNQGALQRFFDAFLARQQPNATADVVPFDIELHPPQRGLDVSNLQPLGATNLFAVASELPRIVASLPLTTRIVLVTDGLTSLGDSRDVATAMLKLAELRRPVTIVNAAATADDHLLSNTANATGGWWIDLSRTDPETAAATAMRIPVRLRLPEPLVPQTLVSIDDARFAVAAKSGNALTTLRIRDRELPLRELSGAKVASMVRRAWARARLRELLARNAPDDELIAHGRAFTQLTPRTSLLVLESWRDYEMYGIPMPPDVAKEKAAFEMQHAAVQIRLAGSIPTSKIVPGGWFLAGRVLDSSGQPLPGVTVLLLDNGNPLVVDVTDAEGQFVVSVAMPPAKPGLRAELSGFGAVQRQFNEPIPSGATYDLTMSAAVTEAITVTAQAPTVESPDPNESAPLPSLRKTVPTTDELLNTLIENDKRLVIADEDEDEDEYAEAVAKRRRELRTAVIDKLRGIGSTAERVRYYLAARSILGGDKGFHVFAAEVFRDKSPELAARVLSDLAEARPDDAPLLRLLARVLDGWGEGNLAKLLLQRAIEIAPDQPQSWREMILVEAHRGAASSAASWSKRMFATQHTVMWSSDEVYEQTTDALKRWDRAGMFERSRGIDLRADPSNDLTMELMFDSGWCYVDLHVTEPSGEEVSWDHTASKSGAEFTGGATLGFGPEIYTLKKAPPGTYKLMIDYWSTDRTNVSLEALVHVVVYERGKRRDHFVVMGYEDEDRPLPDVVVK